MAEDSVLLRELTGLREEVSSSRRERRSRAAARAAASDEAAGTPVQPIEAIEAHGGEVEMRELVVAIKEFTQDAERSASAHPAAAAIGAMAAGILIGRLLGRR